MRRWQKGRFAEQCSAKLEYWTTGTLRFAALLLAALASQLAGVADAFAQAASPVTIRISKVCEGTPTTDSFQFITNGTLPSFSLDCIDNSFRAFTAKKGANQIGEEAPPGWELLDVECIIPSTVSAIWEPNLNNHTYQLKVNVSPQSAAGIIDCWFTNQASPPPSPGTITITKTAVGAGNLPFEFVGNLGTFTLTNGSSTPFSRPEGFYWVRETQPTSPWSLTGLNCEADDQSWVFPSVAERTVAIFLASGGNVSCTFTNSTTPANTGEIVVEKRVTGTDPIPGGTPFTFTDNFPGGSPSHTLRSGDNYTSGQIPAGTSYQVTEIVPANWSLAALQCRDSSGAIVGSTAGSTATVPLAAGQRITCTFTDINRPSNQGHIIVRKITTPSSTKQFCFESNLQRGDFSLANGEWKNFGPLRSGNYWVEEFPDSPWTAYVDCRSELGVSYIWYPSNKRAEIMLVDGDTVTCTFTNTR